MAEIENRNFENGVLEDEWIESVSEENLPRPVTDVIGDGNAEHFITDESIA